MLKTLTYADMDSDDEYNTLVDIKPLDHNLDT
jgi:hypothetical protein